MIFASPVILWGLFLLAIPIIIHLFQFKRYKKLLFPDVSLLKELQTRSSTRNQLKHLIILFTRLALLAALVLAFADPLLPPENALGKVQPSLVSLYLDNSFSMDAESEKGRVFDQARALAYDIAATYPTSTRFQLITNDLTARQRKALDFNTLLDALDEAETSPQARTVSRIHDFHQQSKDELEMEASVLFLLSDFAGTIDDSLLLGDSLTDVRIVPMEIQPTGNLSVDTVSLASPSVQAQMDVELRIRITNHGTERASEVPVDISLDGLNTCRMVLSLDPGSSLDTVCGFQVGEAGYYRGIVSIQDFPVVYDNNYYFSLLASERIRVVEVGQNATGSPFGKLLDGEAFDYSFIEAGQINLSVIEDASFVIFNQVESWTSGLVDIADELCRTGKTVFIIPPTQADEEDLERLSAGLDISLSRLDTTAMEANFMETRHPLYNDVFERIPENLNYPTTQQHWITSVDAPSNETIIRLLDGQALLGGYERHEGKVYYTVSPLNDAATNFHRHALFVPAVYNMAIQSGNLQSLAYPVGVASIDPVVDVGENTFIQKSDDSLRFRPAPGVNEIMLYSQVSNDGFYEITTDSSAALLAFNYPRTESEIAPLNQEQIDRLNDMEFVSALLPENERVEQQIAEADLGTRLWPMFMLLALTLASLETIILKLLKS